MSLDNTIRQIIREELQPLRDQIAALKASANSPVEHPIMTTEETAEYLGIHPRTLYSIRKRGDLPFVVLGDGAYRYMRADVDDYLARRKTYEEPSAADAALENIFETVAAG